MAPYDERRHGPTRVVGPGFHERVYAVVKRVPAGFVTTYGDVAEALGLRRAARQVGYALAALDESRGDVPWHRVVSGRGEISHAGAARQIGLLAREGIRVDGAQRIRGFDAARIEPSVLRAAGEAHGEVRH